jgi:DNA polymerase-1
MGRSAPHVVSSIEEIKELITVIQQEGCFVFDVETRGILERHPDLLEHIESDWKYHVSKLKNPSPDIVQRARENIESKYRSMLALDPLRNEVFWIGLATRGHSWAIPMGHNLGYLLDPEEIGDGTTVPPDGYRKVLKSGQESTAKARYHKPAVYSPAPPQLSRSVVFEALKPLFFSNLLKIGHNVKFDARSISKYYEKIPPGPYADTMILQHSLNENMMSYSLENLINANYDKHSAYAREGKLGKIIDIVPFDSATRYVHLDVRWTWMLYNRLWNQIKNQDDLIRVFQQDSQVLSVLMQMENNGIPVDSRQLKVLGKELDAKMRDTLLALSEYAPIGFNPDSTKHKQEFLFNKKRDGGLGLKPFKTTLKGFPSTDSESLKRLAHHHPAIQLLLDWSETQKLKSTYVDGLLPKLNKGRLHPSFHLHRTATGRLSSSDPNLQNIPRDSSVRSLFIPPPGYLLMVADYDQIELRVMAMYSQDVQMMNIFTEGIDIHAGAAALLFDKDVADVTSEERQIGKGANFLTAYGGGYMKLARTTGLDDKKAKYMIDRYYEQFSGITKWKRQVISQGKAKGYVKTMAGRYRRLPDLRSSDDEKRSRAERQAVNAVVQGSAADICKRAMISVAEDLQGTDTHMLVQVHDELVAAVPQATAYDLIPKFIDAMGEGKVIRGVPLRVSCHVAGSWSEAKG